MLPALGVFELGEWSLIRFLLHDLNCLAKQKDIGK